MTIRAELNYVDQQDLTVTVTLTVAQWKRICGLIGDGWRVPVAFYGPLEDIRVGVENAIRNILKREEISIPFDDPKGGQ